MSRSPAAVLAVAVSAAVLAAASGANAQVESAARPTIRDLGRAPGILSPGPLNAITDVAGVKVGQVTLREGDSIRTGVTAIVPHGGSLFRDKVPAGLSVANGFGKLAGATQIVELGEIETPIVLTNTLSVARGIDGVLDWTLKQPGHEDVRSVNAVMGALVKEDYDLDEKTRQASLTEVGNEHMSEILKTAGVLEQLFECCRATAQS